ncbi:MAG TPA: hypothetical protein PK624_02395 [Spirochaetota bacterium]|nr:hypothetical protein [Spirochaetota bacterium]HOR43624.1 hypothetical protein [Spirochaetota bacterium]HOU83501.1 hypothetical protein [Spirochaetota bacterium]HPK55057.1 hypothetical protein [Spirochaetota bacterium]HQE59813.1 hypothetical protein [Spirochaetota bacterium]
MKKIKSTLLINKKAFLHISDLCRKNKTTISKSIERILTEMIKLQFSTNNVKTFSSVKYQKRGEEYSLVHYSTAPNTYESLLDIRKMAKLSISRMLSDFILNFLKNKDDMQYFMIFFTKKCDRNQVYYNIMSHFNIASQTLRIAIAAKLE